VAVAVSSSVARKLRIGPFLDGKLDKSGLRKAKHLFPSEKTHPCRDAVLTVNDEPGATTQATVAKKRSR
jgi:hypothetical protein